MLRLNHTSLHKIKVHAMTTYPEECCGVLMGRKDDKGTIVCDVLALKNTQQENRTHRFLITPQDYAVAEQEANKEGVDVIGFYHSHSDHPAQPSPFDLEHALPWWSCVIVSVDKGQPSRIKSWLLKDDRSSFEEEKIDVTDGQFKHSM